MRFGYLFFASAILAVAAGPALAAQNLEVDIQGQRDWDWNALLKTTHGAYAPYAAIGRAFAAEIKFKYSGPSWEKDTLHVPLIPDGAGKFSGQGRWDAETLWPNGTGSMKNFAATVRYKTPVVIRNLKPFVHARLDRTGKMVVDLDILLSGPATGGAYETRGHLGDITGHIRGSQGSGAYNSDVDAPGAASGRDRVGASGGTSTFQGKGDVARAMEEEGQSPTQTRHVGPPPKLNRPAYIHLSFSIPWKNGAVVPVRGHDEYGTYNYTVRVEKAAFIAPPQPAAPRGDIGFCVAGVTANDPHLNRHQVAVQCGCYMPKLHAAIGPADYKIWHRMVGLTAKVQAGDQQAYSALTQLMSHAPPGWQHRFEAADAGSRHACHITDWH